MRKNSFDHHHSANCRELFVQMSEYLDGELNDEERRSFEAHLGNCPTCRVCLKTLERTINLCRHLPSSPMGDTMSERLQTVFAKLIQSK